MGRAFAMSLSCVALAACELHGLPGDGGGGAGAAAAIATSSTTSGAPYAGPTYEGKVRGFVEAHCTACHVPEGQAPFSLATYDDVQAVQAKLVDAVSSGEMPPYLPRDGCRPIANAPVVPASAIADLEAWRSAGFPRGDDGEYHGPDTIPETPGLTTDPTFTMATPAPYTPVAGGPDEVKEWVSDEALPSDMWIVASELRPSAPGVVHHANAFLETDGTTPDTLPIPTSILGGWAPGYAPLVFPAGSALFAPAGAHVRFIVHYSTIGLAPGDPVPADQTELRLWTLPAGTRPAYEAFFDAISDSDLFVPAEAPHVDVHGERPLSHEGAPIVGLIPHMHLLGVAFHSDLLHPDGSSECLVDVPSYDFYHQSLLLFAPSAEAAVGMGDVHRMTCTYDNSPANQPMVNGVPKVPVDVTWGDASTDEMCMDILLRVAPLAP